MIRRTAIVATLTILMVGRANVFAAESLSLSAAMDSIGSADLRRHIDTLADDALEGRGAGTRGGYAAAKYLQTQVARLGLTPAGEDESFVQLFDGNCRNLLALIPGSDEKLKREIIVVCAHYDHVGYGTWRNSRGPVGYIHNGADDNASGTSAVIEVAEAFSKLAERPRRSILFCLWDGEEGGLRGSRHWVANPTIEFDRVRRVVNIDMLGRLRDRGLEVLGTRTAPGSRRLVSEMNVETEIPLKFTWRTKANSDHYPFFEQGVPYLIFHTGLHDDYHRPSDDVEKLNIEGLKACTRLVFQTVNRLASEESLTKFRGASHYEALAAENRHHRSLPPLPSRLGISWNVDRPEGGLLVTDVHYAMPAARAGLRRGDRIIEFGETKIDRGDREAAERFRSAVMRAEKKLELRVSRQGETKPVTLTAKLDGKPTRIGIAWRSDSAEPGVATIVRVVPGSPAARADLRVTDRIYSVGGESLRQAGQLAGVLKKTNGSIDLVVERRGQLRTVTLEGI